MRFYEQESGVDCFQDRTYYISLRSPAHEYFRNEFRILQRYDDKGFIIAADTVKQKKSVVKKLQVFYQNIRKRKNESMKINRGTEAYMYFATEQKSNIVKDINGNIIIPTVKVMKKVI